MNTPSERITSLCSTLGQKKGNDYMPSDDCQINLDELAYSIWRDDEAQRNVSVHIYDLGVFEKDFIPILLLEEPLSYIALKAMTACTFPFSPNVQDPSKHMSILQRYKQIVAYRPEVFARVLEYCASIIENPRAEQLILNKAELAITFIRNIVVIPSVSDVHQSIFRILDESLLFDVIVSLKLSRFGAREAKFSRLLAGILYGALCPFMPLSVEINEPSKSSNSFLGSFLADQKKQQKVSSRHSHWNTAITVKSKNHTGFTFNGPINSSIILQPPSPNTFHIRSKARPIDTKPDKALFTQNAESIVSKIMESKNFFLVFRSALPRSFSAYDKSLSIKEQLQMVEMTTFFYEFCLKRGGKPKAYPIASPDLIKYFLSMTMFWLEAKLPNVDGVSLETAIQTLCSYFSSLCSYLVLLIQTSTDDDDIRCACEAVSDFSSDIENILITILCQKTKSKTPLSMLKNSIVALERLYRMYSIAQDRRLVKKKVSRVEDEATATSAAYETNVETFSLFSSDMIISRLSRRQDVLIPFFTLLRNYETLGYEEIRALTLMFRRFCNHPNGLAHLFNLPYIYTIHHLLRDNKFTKSDDESNRELIIVLREIVSKFFFNVKKEHSILISVLAGVEPHELYNEEAIKRAEKKKFLNELGLSNDVVNLLETESHDTMNEIENKENEKDINDESISSSQSNSDEEHNASYDQILKDMAMTKRPVLIKPIESDNNMELSDE